VPGWREAGTSARLVIGAAAACSLFMLKQGTFFNVLDPLEPFLAILAVTGACLLWERNRPRMRALVAFCALGAALHIASVSGSPAADRVAAAVAAHSRPDAQPGTSAAP
jgi:hypothetical protein